ncbi:hypothetical protein [Streptomyces dysideae]|uniref:Gliding motility protein n=1 Tax=Streptomyces dysideae TaxID=909626 RepID=A0A101UVG8_9ACTN|nr:hypothetical protein [Streptomyces dysideae]KUO17531.1 hypothetical protein AQJ91_29470 [Streptomyces dysideae]
MGVFARLLRRSKAAEETSTAEAQADTLSAEPAADEAAEVTEPAEAGTEETAGSTATEAVEAVAAESVESVEIPQQQSADKAADSEAGEGART